MANPAAPVNGKYRVLVVEDDHHIARLILANLAKAGLECRYAPDGNAGLTAFKETDPHLVLTDIMMPGLNGRELCAKIRELSSVPIIMMTAADSDEAQLQGFKMGADDYVPKPFNPRLMVARVIAHLRRVYRYDITEEEQPAAAPASSGMPAGWAVCDSCDFMGPRERFDGFDARGQKTSICPNCKSKEQISYSVA